MGSTVIYAGLLCLLVLTTLPTFVEVRAGQRSDTSRVGTQDSERTFRSGRLGGELIVLPGVFNPLEAEVRVLPFLKENEGLFPNKEVLEMGTGSGIISLYAAQLGAARVVATDINPNAIRSTQQNAERLGLSSVLEARLVPPSDTSAYSVIRPEETFDIVISSPPYSLDLDAPSNDAVVDRGDLGLSIIRGFPRHLKPGGVSILFYDSLFYHLVMVKYARYQGYTVRNQRPSGLTPWEAAPLFNCYLERLLEREKINPNAFRFFSHERGSLEGIGVVTRWRNDRALFPGNSNESYPGMIVIEQKSGHTPAR